jgi:hypothetical protein
MFRRNALRLVAGATAALALSLGLPSSAFAASSISRGPNTTTDPYLRPVADGVHLKSLLTVDDAGSASNGYEMVGIPDGLGASEGIFGSAVITMNHELTVADGIPRRHGQKGAFVSQLLVGTKNDKVLVGRDLINPGVQYWDYVTSSYTTTPNTVGGVQPDGDVFPGYTAEFGRFCSASLTDPLQLFNWRTFRGYLGQIRFANEETGDEGRTFGIDEFGRAWQLPRLGLFSWENTLAAHNRSDTTLVMGQEDGPADASELWVYVGTKQYAGSPVDKAGLTNGDDHVVDVVNAAVTNDAQFRTTFGKNNPQPFVINDVDWDQSGKDQNVDSKAEGLALNRIEDGAFDPNNPNDFYFVTTQGGPALAGGLNGGGLWKLHWNDIENPDAGGTLTLLLDGTEGLVFPDNIDIDTHGNILIQEDPGNRPVLARVMAYRITDGKIGTVATFDPAQFTPGAANFITQDEESSGIIDVEDVYDEPGTFLLDAQVHKIIGGEFVEMGQLLRMQVTNWSAVYGS